MNVTSVLLVDDSQEIFEIVKSSIGTLCTIKWAENLQQAQAEISQNKFDLIWLILNILFPYKKLTVINFMIIFNKQIQI